MYTYNFHLRIKYLVVVIETTFNDGLVNGITNYIKLRDKSTIYIWPSLIRFHLLFTFLFVLYIFLKILYYDT